MYRAEMFSTTTTENADFEEDLEDFLESLEDLVGDALDEGIDKICKQYKSEQCQKYFKIREST